MIDFWTNDVRASLESFRRLTESGAGPTSFAGIARVWVAWSAAIVGDDAEREAARLGLEKLPTHARHGVPWPAYRLAGLARLAEADGRAERARTLALRFESVQSIPVAGVILAEVLRRTGEPAASISLLDQLRHPGYAPYIKASALVTRSLILASRGRLPEAHDSFESALDTAAPIGATRPFCNDDSDLQSMLVAHAAWGTRHESFIASLGSPASHARVTPLTARELEILGYLRTTMTNQEIAAASGVSVNTVKTHVRAIYRKLGVDSRRDAVRSISR